MKGRIYLTETQTTSACIAEIVLSTGTVCPDFISNSNDWIYIDHAKIEKRKNGVSLSVKARKVPATSPFNTSNPRNAWESLKTNAKSMTVRF